MKLVVACAGLVSCFTGSAHDDGSSMPRGRGNLRWSDASPGPGVHTFDDLRGFTYRKCTASAPPEITLELQAHPSGKAPFAIAIELHHGAADKLPREIAVGGALADRCDPGCTGKVWLDELVPGKQIKARIDLAWADGTIAHQQLVVPWSGGAWEVRPCPGPPDAHP